MAGPASKDIESKVPEAVATAVIEFLTGALIDNPHRVGKQLRNQLAGRYAARRGAFRIIYRMDDAHQLVTVLRIEHRADVYRPH
ncbi:MAG: type II toxin-antitoxin system RelE family toxin [Sciscionella sp.]